ncbi:hypothetical protein [Galbibacter mesophilus]|uniref:hypothetical protein n=1 Tax=Galbibacter mesophilus TaxID=379069 RepID=UPI00191D890C|nr:hypothetical protein [Galbibacter mesophilus]MCM5664451.1 hypothetical protein [Galbibacter mesophilus]
MLSKKIRKQILYGKLNELLKPKGYKLIDTGLDPRYILKLEHKIEFIFFNFKDAGSVSASELLVSINEVESIILEIELPNFDLTSYKGGKKYFFSTIKDIVFNNEFDKKFYLKAPETEVEMEAMATWLVNYLQTRGFAFAEHYSYLPNILAKMDALLDEGRFWNGILAGTVDNAFRGLIISKLCNDSNLEGKIKLCDKKLKARESLSIWLPYYEKLKDRLKSIEPKYDASTGRVFEFDKI